LIILRKKSLIGLRIFIDPREFVFHLSSNKSQAGPLIMKDCSIYVIHWNSVSILIDLLVIEVQDSIWFLRQIFANNHIKFSWWLRKVIHIKFSRRAYLLLEIELWKWKGHRHVTVLFVINLPSIILQVFVLLSSICSKMTWHE
jgi:hypothetical protein